MNRLILTQLINSHIKNVSYLITYFGKDKFVNKAIKQFKRQFAKIISIPIIATIQVYHFIIKKSKMID